MIWVDWGLSLASLAVMLMWARELREIFKSDQRNLEPHHGAMGQRGGAKSDAGRAFRPQAEPVGQLAAPQAQNAGNRPLRHRSRTASNGAREAGASQTLAESLSQQEGVSQ